jgi:CPA2 family monovalent cation:H+ antiporter-2
LPPALGAFAAGLVLSGNRMTHQVEVLILPYRQSFGVVFFVCPGTLLDLSLFMTGPLLLIVGLFGVLVVKVGAGAVALRVTGLPWQAATGMELGLAQMGE